MSAVDEALAAWRADRLAREQLRLEIVVELPSGEIRIALRDTQSNACLATWMLTDDVGEIACAIVAPVLGGIPIATGLSNAAGSPTSAPSPERVAVLRQTLRRLGTLADLRTSPVTSVRWLLLDRLVRILSARDERLGQLATQLDSTEVASLAELLDGARRRQL